MQLIKKTYLLRSVIFWPRIYSQSFNISHISQIRAVQLTRRFVDHYESILITNRSDRFSTIRERIVPGGPLL